VGRKQETEAILADLGNIAQGAAACRFIVGRYGAGKSFLLQVVRNYAMDRGFAVCDCDLSPDKKLSGSKGEGLATYRELVTRLATKMRPDGGALEAVLQKWINGVKAECAVSVGLGSPQLDSAVEEKILHAITSLEGHAHGFDFAAAVCAYYRAYAAGDEEKKSAAVKWLRGEYATKREARSRLPVGEIVTDENWYDFLKLLAHFLRMAGHSGLVCFIDECVNLYKIPNRISREKNYEKILAMFNDTMQGKAEGIGFYLAGTPQFAEDDRRGLFSYAALKSRLSESRFAREGAFLPNSPILRLSRLSDSESYLLLEKLRDIHASHYGYDSLVDTSDIVAFMQACLSAVGASDLITPREMARDFIAVLDTLRANPQESMASALAAGGAGAAAEAGEEDDEFTSFEL
jgi:hypothetical protein